MKISCVQLLHKIIALVLASELITVSINRIKETQDNESGRDKQFEQYI